MAARGGHRELSDADIRAVVDFMIAAAALPQCALAAALRYDALGITDREFVSLDANFDGGLTPSETRRDSTLATGFARFDRNRDGKLDAVEYRALELQLENERAALNADDAQLVAELRAVPCFPGKDVRIEAVSSAVILSGVVPGATHIRQAWLATRRVAGIKTWITGSFRASCWPGINPGVRRGSG